MYRFLLKREGLEDQRIEEELSNIKKSKKTPQNGSNQAREDFKNEDETI